MSANALKTRNTSERVRTLVDAALKAKGISGRQASLAVVGHDGLIRDIRAGRLPGLDKLEVLFELLGLETYIGPPRELDRVPTIALDDTSFAQVPLHEASLAAGGGIENNDEHLVGHLAFRRDWLARVGVSPSNAVLARAQGDSMNPCIHDGDLLLIDRSKNEAPVRPRSPTDRRPSPIYALLQDGQARVKRLERPEPGLIMLLSDNPAYGPEVLSGPRAETLNIIGKVMWWGHTNRE